MIFLDNASTTKVFDEVASKMSEVMLNDYFNPSALYREGLKTKNILEDSRKTLASYLNINKNELYFTSCATEANNWIISNGMKNKKGNLVISKGEHPSVYEAAQRQKSKGIDVREVNLLPSGTIDLLDLDKKVDENTSLVSVIHCSNETGAINDINAIVKLVKAKNKRALVHSDGVQAFLKLDTDLQYLGVDFYTITAHKVGGSKGIAALYINENISIAPFIVGGGQERGLRSGTENTPAIAGFVGALKCFDKVYDKTRVRAVHDYFLHELLNNGWHYNGSIENNSGFILSLSLEGIKSEILQHMLSDEGILIGLGSACSSKTSNNRVLEAMGKTKKQIEGNIRISLAVNTSLEDAAFAASRINFYARKLWKGL